MTAALTALLSFFATKAAKEAALAGAKEICKAAGGMDYADNGDDYADYDDYGDYGEDYEDYEDYGQTWADWADEHLASAGSFFLLTLINTLLFETGSFTKTLAIAAGKAFCKAL